MPLFLLAPILAKPIVTVTLIGAAVIGWLGGYQNAKNTALQSAIEDLRAENQRLAQRPADSPPPKPARSVTADPAQRKHTLLAHIVQANVQLREAISDDQHAAGGSHHG